MRNSLLSIVILLFFHEAKPQETQVISITTKDRIFKGNIDDSYPVTMYLKVVNQSEYNGYTQSVKGWYFYDHVGTSIPLAGWNGEGLHLISSEKPQVLERILHFEYETASGVISPEIRLFELEKHLSRVQNVTERFKLGHTGRQVSGTWFGNGKELDVTFYAESDQVAKKEHYLKLVNGDLFALNYLGVPDRASFEVQAQANEGRQIILEYRFNPNPNFMGRCGASESRAKVVLVFDETYALVKSNLFVFEDCYRDIYPLEAQVISESVTEYKIEDYVGEGEPIYHRYLVDYGKATITRR